MGKLPEIQEICPFGGALVEARKLAGISQSRLGMKAECNLSNLRLIERCQIQPGVTLALRLVKWTGTDIMQFFDGLAEGVGIPPPAISDMPQTIDLYANIQEQAGLKLLPAKAVFGRMLKSIRTTNGISQKAMAEAAHYNLRNILNIESKGQEPGIMTAIALVAATGCQVGYFFEVLQGVLVEMGD